MLTTIVIAHSVVSDTDGTLCDITTNELDVRLPFVRHVVAPEEFELIAAHEPFTLEFPTRCSGN